MTRRRLTLVAVVLLVGILGGCSSSSKRLTDADKAGLHLRMAEASLLEGDPTGALQQATVAEELDPKNPGIYLIKGMAFHTKKDLNEAIRNLELAVKMAPTYTEAQNIYGKMLLDAGRYSEAEGPLQKAAFNPLYREAYKAKTSLGILYYRQEKEARSIDFFEQAITEAPQKACVAHYYLGHIHLKHRRFPESIKSYKKASDHFCAGFSDAHLALGMAYERSKSFDQARVKYLEVGRTFPETPAADQARERLRYLP